MAYTFTRRISNEIIDASHINELQAAIEDLSANGAITIADSASITLSLVNGELVATANFGTEEGTIAEGSALAGKADAEDLSSHINNVSNPHIVTKSQVGLGNVDNTSDLDKPVSAAAQLALSGKANVNHSHEIDQITNLQAELDSKAGEDEVSDHIDDTTNPHGVTKAQVGLGNVNNTSDLDKPISTAVESALSNKADTSHSHQIAHVTNLQGELDAKANADDFGDHIADAGNPHSVTKAQVGLSNVDNTSDANKPVSSAVQAALNTKAASEHTHDASDVDTGTLAIGRIPTGTTSSTVALGNHLHTGVYALSSHTHAIQNVTGLQAALDSKADDADLTSHVGSVNNPHAVTKTQVGLGNVPNIDATSRLNHTGTQSASTIYDFDSAADARITAQKGVANGLATLGADSRIPSNQIPPIAMTDSHVVASEAAMLSLTAQEGDIAIRTDVSRTFIHNGGSTGTTADWTELSTPSDAVLSVNDQTGTVVLNKTDVGLSNVDNTSDIDKPISSSVQGALDGKANSSHNHDASHISSGTLALARIPTGTTSSTVALGNHNHNSVYSPLTHTHAIGDVSGLQIAIDGKAPLSHTHNISDVEATGTPSSSTYLRGDGSWTTPPNTTYTLATQAEVENPASATARLVSGQRLAQAVAAHAPVKTADLSAHTGNTSNPHGVTKAQIGLGNVENTSDANKPISSATQLALNAKADAVHLHDDRYYTETEVDDFLSDKSDVGHGHTIADTSGLQTALNGKAASSHTHDDRYYTESEVDDLLEDIVAGEPAPHDHDDRYYTETEVDTALAGKSDTTHNHTGVYAPLSHTHEIGNVTGLESALDSKSPTTHDHDADYADINHNHDGTYSPATHTHDDRYYTETEVDASIVAAQDADRLYVQSRGQNLITNGSGILGNNYNFSWATFDPSEVYAGKGSFRVTGKNNVFIEEPIPVDFSKVYNISTWAKASEPNSRMYFGVASYDVDDNTIMAYNVDHFPNSRTTLSQDLNPGDTVVHVTSAEGWVQEHTTRRLLIFGYQNSYGYTYPDYTYSRITTGSFAWDVGSIDYVNNTITLNSPFPATWGTIPAGRAIAHGTGGGSYQYPGGSNIVPTEWTEYTGRMGIGSNKFMAGTAFIRVLFLFDYNNLGVTTYVSSVNFSEAYTYDTDVAVSTHVGAMNNPHNVTAAQVGLGNVDNTSDANKPISTATQAALDNKSDEGHNHDARYYTESEVDSALAGKSNTGHTHDDRYFTETEVTNALAGKANTSHSHTASNITDFSTAADARILAQKGSANGLATLGADSKIPTSQIPALAMTDVHTVASQAAQLGLTAQEGDVAIRTDQGRTYIHNGGSAGTMADWTEISSPDAVTSVNGQTGVVSLGKGDVGLGNVDNTSDANKPISTAVQTALNGKAASSHTHAISNVTGLQTALDGKAASTHSHVISDTSGLQDALNAKAASSHTHAIGDLSTTGTASGSTYLRGDGSWTTPPNTTYSLISQVEAENAASTATRLVSGQRLYQAVQEHAPVKAADLATKADTGHTHDDRYYTETEIDTALAGKASTGHDHDDRYYTETEIDTALGGKADTTHTHSAGDITSGTFAIGRIPTGTTSSTVALGNHTHAGYALTSHTHAIANVTGLQTALDGKASSSHTHAIEDLNTSGTASASTYLRGDGSWSTPTNTTYAVMTQAEAEAGTATTARTISADRLKGTILYYASPSMHTHDAGDISSGTLSISRIPTGTTGSTVALGNHTHAGYAASSHTHSANDITTDVLNIARIPTGSTSSTVALGNHTHAEYASSSHTHDDRYYTESEVDSALGGKANASHTHAIGDLNTSGTASTSTYLRGDGNWMTPPNTSYSLMSTSEAQTGTATSSRVISAARLTEAILHHAPAASHTVTSSISFNLSGSGNPITPGNKGFMRVPFACNITQFTLLGDVTGSISVKIWKDSYSSFGDGLVTMMHSGSLGISSTRKGSASTSSWTTTSIDAGDVVGLEVVSVSNFTEVNVALDIERSV